MIIIIITMKITNHSTRPTNNNYHSMEAFVVGTL